MKRKICFARSLLTLTGCGLWLFSSSPLAQAQENDFCRFTRLTPCVALFESGEHLDTDISLVRDIVSADFDSDGHLDLAVQDAGTYRVLVYLGRGDGTFEMPTVVRTGSWPTFMAAGDLDGDGALDLATANGYRKTVSVLFGDGAGGFPRRADLALGNDPRALTVSDLDGDGRADLIVTDGTDPSVYVLFGPVDGHSVLPLELALTGLPLDVVAADLNGNGQPDLTILSGGVRDPDVLEIFLDFTTRAPSGRRAVDLVPGEESFGLAVADLNGDHRPDFAVTGNHGNRCLVYLAGEGGSYGPPRDYPVSLYPLSVTASDVNRDGIPDLLVTCELGSSVSCLLGLGEGRFVHQGDYCVDERPQSLVAADLDEDGWPDIATASIGARWISLLWNRGVALGTPFSAAGTIRPPIDHPGGNHSGLLRIQFPLWIDSESVDIGSIRIEGKQMPTLRPAGAAMSGHSRAPHVILRFDPADLAGLEPGSGPLRLTGCLFDGRPFGGGVRARSTAQDLDDLVRVEARASQGAVGLTFQLSFPGSVATRWTLQIFDVRGGLIWSRSERVASGGVIAWDQSSRTGGRVPSGVYFYRVESDVGIKSGKLPVLR